MVATTDAILADAFSHRMVNAPVRTVDGARFLARGAQSFSGTVLILVAVGLWIGTSAQYELDMMLIKLGLSLFAALAGIALIRGGRAARGVELEIDLVADELRLVRPQPGMFGQPEIVHRCAFSDLVTVDVVEQMVRMWDGDGTLLAEVPMSDPQTRSELLRALSAHGKL